MKNCEITKTYLVQEVKAEEPAGTIVAGCEKSILVKELAELLQKSGTDTGEVRLYQWLREHGYVYRQPCGKNMPTKKSLEFGVLEVRKRQYEDTDGHKGKCICTLAVTPKGQEYFMLILGSEGNICHKSA